MGKKRQVYLRRRLYVTVVAAALSSVAVALCRVVTVVSSLGDMVTLYWLVRITGPERVVSNGNINCYQGQRHIITIVLL